MHKDRIVKSARWNQVRALIAAIRLRHTDATAAKVTRLIHVGLSRHVVLLLSAKNFQVPEQQQQQQDCCCCWVDVHTTYSEFVKSSSYNYGK